MEKRTTNVKKNVFAEWKSEKLQQNRVMIEKIVDDDNVLTITFRNEENKGLRKITFDPYIAFRNMNESMRARTFSENEVFQGSFYIVEQSTWVDWLHEESLGFYEGTGFVHYAIITSADCLDIASEFPPEIEVDN